MKPTLRTILIVLIGYVLFLICVHQACNWLAGAALQKSFENARLSGIPMTAEEIIPPAIPENDNAAPILQDAFALMEDYDGELTDMLEHASHLQVEAEAIPDRTAQLATPEIQAILALLHKAANRPGCSFDLDYSQGASMELPHLSPHTQAVELLCLEALTQARNSRPEAALTTLNDATHLAQQITDEFLIIQYLVWASEIATVEGTTNLIIQTLPPGTLSRPDLLPLRNRFTDVREKASSLLVAALDGERILFGGVEFGKLLAGSQSPEILMFAGAFSGNRWFSWLWISPIFRPAHKTDYRVYHESMVNIRKTASLSVSGATTATDFDSETLPWLALCSRLALPVMSAVAERRGRIEANSAVSEAGIALELHHLTNGKYPASLTDLSPDLALPNDPFTGKSLIYKPTAHGFILYSLGPNRKDDHGTTKRDNRKNYDIIWKIDRSPQPQPDDTQPDDT